LDGFSDEDRQSFKSIIYNNIMGSIRVLVDAAITMNIDIQVGNRDAAKRVMDEVNFQGQITEQMAKDIKGLWQDKGIQIAFQRSSEFQLNDSAEYYFVELDRIAHPNYMPSVQDILRSRAKTTGIIETEFKIGKQKFTLTDVGGQRSERRKWMHCFQDVTAVIFFSSLAEYDLKLYEDESTNRMHESLKLFKDICNTKWFIDTNIILFLNKKDLFEKKIKRIPLSVCFKDYKGSNTFDEASQYIEDQFLAQNENPKKLIYVHKTCATDTDNISVVFKAVVDAMLVDTIDKGKSS